MTAATMTKLPPDSFLPSGAVDSDFRRYLSNPALSSDSSSSGISPFALPSAPVDYFDSHVNGRSRSNQRFSPQIQPNPHGKANGLRSNGPLSPRSISSMMATHGSSGPSTSQFLSPHLTPTSTQIQYQMQQQKRQQQRSASLSPTRKAANSMGGFAMGRTRSAMASPSGGLPTHSSMPLDGAISGTYPSSYFHPPASGASSVNGLDLSRSISADATTTTAQSTIQHLKQQNKAIREAWENERKYLEANRSRAEEVYKEERALMEEERSEWDAERASLLERIQMLENRNGRFSRPERIEEENLGPSNGLNGGAWDGSPDSVRSSRSSQGRQPWNGSATQKPPFQTGASPTSSLPAELSNVPGLTHLPPALLPQAAPFVNQSQEPHPDFLATDSMDSPEGSGTPMPSVDIQEIHPELEGISLKANAITKPTFDFTSASPPESKLSSGRPSPPIDPVRPPLEAKASSREQTLQVLAAKKEERLTMHAGHTPSHSLSLIPTAVATNAPTTASSSGEATPTIVAGLDGLVIPADTAEPANAEGAAPAELDSNATAPKHQTSEAHPEPTLEPVDDVELKGPLMVRNIPAKDEIFFRRLSEKLQDVVESHDPPTVVKTPSPVLAALDRPQEDNAPAAVPGGLETEIDGANEKSGSSKGSPIADDEVEVPLKLKQSNNFGAPFGAVRQFAF